MHYFKFFKTDLFDLKTNLTWKTTVFTGSKQMLFFM